MRKRVGGGGSGPWLVPVAIGPVVIGLLAGMSFVPPAHAQGWLDFLFNAPPSRQRMPTVYRRGIHSPHRSAPGGYDGYSSSRGRLPYRQSRRWRGHYRTVCVRLCDGYYFPIGHGVSRSSFYDDANACQAQCPASEARLFHMPASHSRIEAAVDHSGLQYSSLENAFLYRKRHVKNCTCQPKPWAVEAMVRHENYAAEEADRRARERPTDPDQSGEGQGAGTPEAPSGQSEPVGRDGEVGKGEAPRQNATAAAPRVTQRSSRGRRPAHRVRRSRRAPASSAGWFGWPAGSGNSSYRWPGGR